MRTKLIVICICGFLLAGLSFGSTYPDKHGNQGTLTLGSVVVNNGGSSIDYTVPYTLTDSEGAKSGEYIITSEMLPGRDAPDSDDFVLNVFVSDDDSQNAAVLVFRNNPNESPLAPILRLLDCSSSPCIEVRVYDNEEWGCWIIQDQSDIADYPIELLDARVIIELLEPAQLSQLPDGNWADIMENHRTNFEEARFRADSDHLGDTQSDLLTSRMIDEITDKLGMADDIDWLRRHSPGIAHNALTFLTDHRALIEADDVSEPGMTKVLFDTHLDDWPSNFTFPFGRMPIWLVNPDHDAGGATPCLGAPSSPNCRHVPLHWERVTPTIGTCGGGGQCDQDPSVSCTVDADCDVLENAGCFHDFPPDTFVPTTGNLSENLGQYVCAEFVTPNGFVDRPCTDPNDYFVAGIDSGNPLHQDLEGFYHNPVHFFIGGAFLSGSTTAGTMVFWAFHTSVSTNLLANWRHAQMRGMPEPNRTPECDANGAYLAECQGLTTDVLLDGAGSSDPDGDPLTYEWTTDCPGGTFSDDTSATPTLTADSSGPLPLDCTVTLTVTDDNGASAACDADVTIEDTTPPEIMVALDPPCLWPPNHKLVDIAATVDVTDICDPAPTFVLTSITSDEPDNGQGIGDGNTTNDIQDGDLGTPDLAFKLRAERAGRLDGRTYTVTYTAMDASGNMASDSATVFVRHDQSQDCEGISAAPSQGENLIYEPLELSLESMVDGTLVTWTPVVGAGAYEVIRGELGRIHETEAAIELGAVTCIRDLSLDETTAGFEDDDVPAPGMVFFYLTGFVSFDGSNNFSRSAYGTESASKPRVTGQGDCMMSGQGPLTGQ